jgi:hypothetical protein
VVVVVDTELEGAALEGAPFSPVEFPSWMDWLRDYTGEPDYTEYELEEVRQMRPDQMDEADKRDAVPMRAEATDWPSSAATGGARTGRRMTTPAARSVLLYRINPAAGATRPAGAHHRGQQPRPRQVGRGAVVDGDAAADEATQYAVS